MRDVTLCFLLKNEHVCLALKKRGFGEGKWNGVGGKVEKNESIENAAVREINEEIGVDVHEENLEKVAVLDFTFEKKDKWAQRCHVFLISEWQKEPIESEEMKPEWFHKKEIPFEKMWVDDPLWLPHALENKKVEAAFHFSSDGSDILEHTLNTFDRA